MISLYDSNISDILPESISELPNVKALGYAISQAIKRLIEYSENTSVYAMIDSAPEEILDMLALDLNTQYYDDTLDIESKRNLVKSTFIWYTNAGTPSSVEELVKSVFGYGEVKEWFEYGDDPYYFKVVTDASFDEASSDLFSRMLGRVKNERSHIRVIEMHRTAEQTEMCGVGLRAIYKPAAIIESLDIGDSGITSVSIEGADLVCEYYGDEPDISLNSLGELTIDCKDDERNIYYDDNGDLIYEF